MPSTKFLFLQTGIRKLFLNIFTQKTRSLDIGFGLIIISYLLVVFSYPMPHKIGGVEIIMGAVLTIGSLILGFTLAMQEIRGLKLLALCVSYFFFVPLLVGVLHGNSLANIARDVAPLMFMVVIPLLIILLPQDRNTPYRLRTLLAAILAVGLVSAIQFHYGTVQLFNSMSTYTSRYGATIPEGVVTGFIDFMLRLLMPILKSINVEYAPDDFQMLVVKCQDPAILFSAIYLLCIGLALVLVKPRRLPLGSLALTGGWFCVYEFSALGMRAFSGLTALALIIYALHIVKSKKLSVNSLIVAGILGLLLTYSQIIDIAKQMLAKHQAAGFGGRLEELLVVFSTISENFITLLLGVGWGGLLVNPIYEGSATRFTHSLISYWLLKTGIVGFVVMVLFLILLLRRVNLKCVRASDHRLAISLAASAAIIISLLFEPTYKMLSFGLIVGLLLAELPSSPDNSTKEQLAGNSPN